MTKRAMRRARARASAALTPRQETVAPLKVTREHVAAFRAVSTAGKRVDPFALPSFPPGTVPDAGLAQDDALSATGAWAAAVLSAQQIDAAIEGQHFLGYSVLSAMAQRPEYRRIVETIATEMTRKWIRLINRKGGEQTQDRIDALNEAMERLCVRDAFRKVAEGDGFFGRGHLYIALEGDQIGDELRTPIGDGRGAASRQKVRKGKLLRLQPLEAVWAYPQAYNSTNPLDADWYTPQIWYVQGKPIHRSRLLTFVGREVPDLLKSAYAFGGLAMTQMARPYVANWLRTREDVSDLIAQFSVSGVKGMDLTNLLAAGAVENLQNRVDMFVAMRDNRGFMALNQNEEFFNVSTPLGTLDKLQAQAQEQIASICGIPLVKLLGVTPSGLNASSDGEVRVFYDFIHAYQEKLFGENLKRVLAFVQLSEFGDVDEDVGFEFEPLWQMGEKEKADVALTRAQAIMTTEPVLNSDVVLRELREIGDTTGVFTQITDDDISEAETEAPAPEPLDPDADQPDDGTEPLPAMDEWQENKHPRAGNGQFGYGGGSAGGSSSSGAQNSQSETVAQRGKLTEQQHVDMKDYKEGGFRDLNAYLRGGQTRPGVATEYDKTAKRMDAAIAKSSLKQDTKLYRGIDHPLIAANAEKLIGRDVDVATFQSTSTDSRVATDFAGMGKGAVVFQINAKAGTPALGMDQFEVLGNSGENEVLLGRGGKMRITGVDRSGSVPVILAEYIASNTDKPRTSRDSLYAVDEAAKRDASRFVIGEEEADEIFGKYLQD